MQSLYREQPGWLHAVPAWLKLAVLAAVGTGLFLTARPAILLPAAAVCGAIFLSLRPVGPGARRLVWSIAIAAALVAAFHALMGQPMQGLTSAARLLAMTLLGISLTLTTRHTELLEVFERLLSPLGRLGLRVDGVSLRLALMMRFIEHFFVQWKRLDDAHRVRTGRPGGWRLLAPLTIQMLLTARRVADTLQIRLGK